LNASSRILRYDVFYVLTQAVFVAVTTDYGVRNELNLVRFTGPARIGFGIESRRIRYDLRFGTPIRIGTLCPVVMIKFLWDIHTHETT